ncbi:hypothetical protein ACFWXA_13725 [Streptomyces atroolivaceus]|uniref:hypothetical protein n=1 Tax=Streptomyces atroolivaceus TaxID=66869 RepID=UPI003650573E
MRVFGRNEPTTGNSAFMNLAAQVASNGVLGGHALVSPGTLEYQADDRRVGHGTYDEGFVGEGARVRRGARTV